MDNEIGINSGVNKFVFAFGNIEVFDKAEYLWSPEIVAKDIELKNSFQQDSQIANKKMPLYRVFLLYEDRPCIQVGLHDPERFLDSPKVIISRIDFFIGHAHLGGNDKVVSGKRKVFVDSYLVYADKGFAAFPVSKSNVFPCFAEIIPLGLRQSQSPCLINHFVDLVSFLCLYDLSPTCSRRRTGGSGDFHISNGAERLV